ncbi:MAG: hypothetical protein K940chlam8_00672 [Chlamydiae bacterium]|nr:hypothetical protein [Chlamydiota bacterium]
MLYFYILKKYCKFFFLIVFSFLAILIITRSSEIAKIAVFTKDVKFVLQFIYLHIPVILPIALCISTFLASFIIFLSLHQTKGLHSLRTQGLSLKAIFLPIGIFTFFLSMTNFYLTSELATKSWYNSKNLPFHFAMQKPISALLAKFQEANQMIAKGDLNQSDQSATDALLFTYIPNYDNLVCVWLDHLHLQDEAILANNVNMVSYIKTQDPSFYNHLVLDYRKFVHAPVNSYLQTYMPELKTKQMDYYTLSQLVKHPQFLSQKSTKMAEIFRRICFGICPFLMMLLGFAFGSNTARDKWHFLLVFLSTLFVFASLLFANAAIHFYKITSLLMALSLCIGFAISTFFLTRYSKGQDS